MSLSQKCHCFTGDLSSHINVTCYQEMAMTHVAASVLEVITLFLTLYIWPFSPKLTILNSHIPFPREATTPCSLLWSGAQFSAGHPCIRNLTASAHRPGKGQPAGTPESSRQPDPTRSLQLAEVTQLTVCVQCAKWGQQRGGRITVVQEARLTRVNLKDKQTYRSI